MEVVCLSKLVEIILGGYDTWCNFFGLKTVWFFFCKSLWHTITDVTLKLMGFLCIWESQGEGVNWKRQWEGQLSGLQYRNTTKDANSNSWGARMRRKKKEQEQQEQSS
jgi:hypothetical protein